MMTLLGAVLLAAAPPDSAAAYVATRASLPIRVDGRLAEAAWADAVPLTGFRQVEPRHGEASAFETVVRVVYGETALYVGVFCRDSLGGRGVRVQDMRRKFDYFANDLFGISLDPFRDGRNSIAFQITPHGAQRELQVYDNAVYNREWEGVWSVRTVIADSGWTAEIAIPWATLRYPPGKATWGANFYRIARRANEVSAWRPWPRNLTAYRMDLAGALDGLEPPPPRANLRIRPYAVVEGARAGAAAALTDDIAPQIGGEITWAPSSSTALDLTVKTDFAQADVDRQVVNLRRFSLFFPERRQFFLESGSLFAAGLTDDFYVVEPFFSRRIGLSDDGTPIPIQAGARLVRRDARSGLGALAIRQDGMDGRGPATFGVGRYSRNLGAGGRVGGLVAARFDEDGPSAVGEHGVVAAGDWFARIDPQTLFQGMLSATSSSAAGGEGAAGYFYVARQTNSLYAGLIEAVVTRDYRPTTGFVSRSDVVLTSPALIGDWRPSWRPGWLRAFKPAVITYLYHGPEDFKLQEGFVQTYVDLVFQSGAVFYPYVERHFQRPTEPFELVRGVTVPAGEQDYWRYGLFLETNSSAGAYGRVDVSSGSFFGGELDRIASTVRMTPSPRASLAVSYEIDHLRGIGTDRSSATTHLLAPELRLALDPRIQLTAFYQYNSDFQRGTWNARFSWEFAPLSYAYLVYNDQRAVGRGLGTVSGLPTQQLVFKLVYLTQL
ncbi:MAG TPA: DUF5916 domain-containing protein [Gemmatimonadales bacterium]|nr:DUF5916 domain-containing protein [Gemmatimonadales bacterium]